MTSREHAIVAYSIYCSNPKQDGEADYQHFVSTVESAINGAMREAEMPDVEKKLAQDITNGQQSGKVELSVGAQGDQVAVDFGIEVRHISFDPDVAVQLARMISKTAKKLKRRSR